MEHGIVKKLTDVLEISKQSRVFQSEKLEANLAMLAVQDDPSVVQSQGVTSCTPIVESDGFYGCLHYRTVVFRSGSTQYS